MSQNPFEAFGEGGFDMNALMQQAQQMQEQLQAAQAQLADTVVEGSVGGVVTVSVNGVGDLVGVDLAPGSVEGADAEALRDLSDMIVAAYRDAKAKAEGLAGEAFGPLAGGLGGPGAGGPGGPGGGPTPGQLGF